MKNQIEVTPPISLRKLGSGAVMGLVGTVGGRLLSLVGNVFAARILGPAVFGIYTIGWTLLRFLSLIAPLGMETGIVKFAPQFYRIDDNAHKGLMLQGLGISLISGITFGAGLFILAPWLAEEVYHQSDLTQVFRYFAFIFPPTVFLVVVSAATRTTQRVGYSVVLRYLGQPIFGLILMLFFYSMGLKLFGVVLADVLSTIILAGVGLYILAKIFPNIINQQICPIFPGKTLLKFSIPASLAATFGVYIFWIDRLFVGYFRSPYENGLYQAASQISLLFSVVLAGINMIVIPIFADASQRKDYKTLQDVYTVATKWGIYLCIPSLVVILMSPKQVLTFLFGLEYSGGSVALMILLFGQFVNLITGSVNPLIMMTGNQNFLVKLSGSILIFEILMNLFLVPRIGLVGASISKTISLGGLFLIALFWVKEKLGLWPYDRRYIKGFLATLPVIVGVGLVKGILPNAGLDLFLQVITAEIIFGLLLLVQKLDEEDLVFINQLLKMIEGRK